MDKKERLVRRFFQWHRDLGFQHFYQEFFTCREAKRLYPDPSERAQRLREHWLELSEDEYSSFRSGFDSMSTDEVSAEFKATRQLIHQPS